MRLQNVPENIKNQWLLIKTATDYLKLKIVEITPYGIYNQYLIANTLDEIDEMFGMRNITTIVQNMCVHNNYGSLDSTLRALENDGSIMIECKMCNKCFPIHAPTPDEVDIAYQQLCEFIQTQIPQESTPMIHVQKPQALTPECIKMYDLYDSLKLVCSKYKTEYEERKSARTKGGKML